MPNFLILGAAKAGTTALYHYLQEHPEIYMSSWKEPGFFAFEGEQLDFCGPEDKNRINQWSVTTIDGYSAMFKDVSNEKAIGEATPLYLYFPKSCERIKHYIPEAKLIAILRNPVERAFSNYVWTISDGVESLNFSQALQAEKRRINDNWGPRWRYKAQGFYYAQLKSYFETFDSRQIKIYLYEDFTSEPVALIQDLFRFLDIDDTFIPHMSRKYNVSGTPRNKALHEFLSKSNTIKSIFKPLLPLKFRRNIQANLRHKNLSQPKLEPAIRKQLLGEYREDILKLQNLIQRDLSTWLEC